jgi:hypothetical protein
MTGRQAGKLPDCEIDAVSDQARCPRVVGCNVPDRFDEIGERIVGPDDRFQLDDPALSIVSRILAIASS